MQNIWKFHFIHPYCALCTSNCRIVWVAKLELELASCCTVEKLSSPSVSCPYVKYLSSSVRPLLYELKTENSNCVIKNMKRDEKEQTTTCNKAFSLDVWMCFKRIKTMHIWEEKREHHKRGTAVLHFHGNVIGSVFCCERAVRTQLFRKKWWWEGLLWRWAKCECAMLKRESHITWCKFEKSTASIVFAIMNVHPSCLQLVSFFYFFKFLRKRQWNSIQFCWPIETIRLFTMDVVDVIVDSVVWGVEIIFRRIVRTPSFGS